jgi:DNA polymerase phi
LLFARLFGLTAIINSGLFIRTQPPLPHSAFAPSTPDSCAAVLAALRELARAKSWLAEAAYWAIERALDLLAAVNDADVPWREEAVHTLLEGVFGEASSGEGDVAKGREVWTAEKMALALRAQRLWPEREREWRTLWAPTIKHGDVLHPANLVTIARIFKVSQRALFGALSRG